MSGLPIGIVNPGVDCWLNALFQCVVWNDAYYEMLMMYLPESDGQETEMSNDDTHPAIFDGDLWRRHLLIYRTYASKVTNLRSRFNPRVFSTRQLGATIFPESKGRKQEDAFSALNKLLEQIPDRKRRFCAEHAPFDTQMLIMYRSRISDTQEDPLCSVCGLAPSTHGYDTGKEMMGRTVHFVEHVPSIPSQQLPKNHTRTRVALSLGEKAVLYFTRDTPCSTQIVLDLEQSKTPVPCNDLLERHVYNSLPLDMRYIWKGVDDRDVLKAFQVIGTSTEFYGHPITGQPPKGLVLTFKRFRWTATSAGCEKVTTPVKMLKRMNFGPLFCKQPVPSGGKGSAATSLDPINFCYDLTGFIVHQGTTADRGHYVAYITNNPNGTGAWFCCDDNIVSEVASSEIDVLMQTAFICFFQRCTNDVASTCQHSDSLMQRAIKRTRLP